MHVYERSFHHFVWSTWDRAPLLEGQIEGAAYALLRDQCRTLKVKLHAIGGVAEHVHLLVTLPRTLCVADFMETVKGVSSRALNDQFNSPAWAFKWQGRYSQHTVSASHVSRVRRYIENQKQHHADGTLWPASEPPEA